MLKPEQRLEQNAPIDLLLLFLGRVEDPIEPVNQPLCWDVRHPAESCTFDKFLVWRSG